MRHISLLAFCALVLAACGMIQQAPPGFSRETKYIEEEYGTGAGAPVRVSSDGRALDFQVWLGTKHARILAQATPETVEAMKAGLSRLSLGTIDRPLDEEPYRNAALQQLAASGKRDCALRNGAQVLEDRFEWTYACAKS